MINFGIAFACMRFDHSLLASYEEQIVVYEKALKRQTTFHLCLLALLQPSFYRNRARDFFIPILKEG